MKLRDCFWFLSSFLVSRLFNIFFYRITNNGQDSLYNNWFMNKFDHWQFGLLMIIVGIILKNKYRKYFVLIGLGLFIEDFTFII